MKILMLSAYLMSLTFFQQNTALLSKKADKTLTTTQQKQKPSAADSKLNATQKNPDQKEKQTAPKAASSPLNRPAAQ
jgi:hypothetical protein